MKIVRFTMTICMLMASLAWLLPAGQETADTSETKTEEIVVAKIGDRVVTTADVQREFARIPPQFVAQFNTPEKKETYVRNLIDRILFAKAAREQGYLEKEEIKNKVEDYLDRMLFSEFLNNETSGLKVDDAECMLYYQEHVSEFAEPAKVKASHILVRDEETALKAKAELDQGAEWDTVVSKYSLDSQTKPKGGDLGYFSKDRMVEAFAEVAFSQEVGTISDPVKTQFGYHIIRVYDKKPEEVKTFEEVRSRVESTLLRDKRTQKVDKIRDDLMKKYAVVFNVEVVQELQIESGKGGDLPAGGRPMPIQVQPQTIKPAEKKKD